MKNFFIPGVSPEKKEKLQEAGVAFCDLVIGGATGIVVDEENLKRCIATLEAEVASEEATELEGIVKISLRFDGVKAPLKNQIEVDDRSKFSCDHWKDFSTAVQQWAAGLAVKGVVLGFCVPESKQLMGTGGEELMLFYGKAPWKNPSLVRDDECKIEYIPGGRFIRMYGFSDCCSSQSERDRFRQVEKFFHLVTASPEEAEKIMKEAREKAQRASREAYVKECSARFEKTVQGTREAIVSGQADIARLQGELTRRIRETAGAEKKMEQLLACKGGELEKYGREFDKLLAVSKVRDVQVADGVVKVFTDALLCTDPRTQKVHEIGKFRIEIFRDCQNGGVRWYNLTRLVEGHKAGMHAPHVFPDGKACFGSTAEIWPELIGNYEFAAAAMVAIQFVESVNTDDSAGKHIDKWPLAATKEVK